MNRSIRRISSFFVGALLLSGGAHHSVAAQQPTKAPFHWGVSGHPEAEYSGIGIPATIKLIKELGCTYYRIDERRASETGVTEKLLEEANAHGIKLLPIIYRPVNVFAPDISMQEIYDKCYARGFEFANKYRGQFDYIEIDNELDYRCIKSGDGSLPEHYDDDKYLRVMNSLKGLADGVRAADPKAKRLIGTCGWYHYGFLDRLLSDGVTFEVISWHWYTNMGSMSRVMSKLSSYKMPIWVTEMNLRDAKRNTKIVEQADAVALYATEMWNMPNVEAVFVYELLDQPTKVTAEKPDDPEPFFGLYTIERDTQTKRWKLGEKKPAFGAYQERIQALGHHSSNCDIIVDDAYQSPAKTLHGTDAATNWETVKDDKAFFKGYLQATDNNKAASSVRFKPFIPAIKQYEVSMWFPSSPANSPKVPVKIKHADGVSTVTIDQRKGGQWVSLGSYNFHKSEPGDGAYVEVSSKNTLGQVIIDAIRFK